MKKHKEILQALIDSGMTQQQIADAIGKSQPWVASVLGGAYEDIKWQAGVALRKLAAERGVSV